MDGTDCFSTTYSDLVGALRAVWKNGKTYFFSGVFVLASAFPRDRPLLRGDNSTLSACALRVLVWSVLFFAPPLGDMIGC